MEPCASRRPIPLHCGRSNFQYLRNLLQGEPGKEAQFYNSALARVDFGQTYKSIIEGYDVYIFSARENLGTLPPRFAAPWRRA